MPTSQTPPADDLFDVASDGSHADDATQSASHDGMVRRPLPAAAGEADDSPSEDADGDEDEDDDDADDDDEDDDDDDEEDDDDVVDDAEGGA